MHGRGSRTVSGRLDCKGMVQIRNLRRTDSCDGGQCTTNCGVTEFARKQRTGGDQEKHASLYIFCIRGTKTLRQGRSGCRLGGQPGRAGAFFSKSPSGTLRSTYRRLGMPSNPADCAIDCQGARNVMTETRTYNRR